MAETILVIEDDESLAQLVQLLLRRTGYNVLVANRGNGPATQSQPDPA